MTEVVRKITWIAGANAGIGPAEFEEFQVSIGRLPATERMVFKAPQTYDSGEVVRWIEEAAPGAATQPEHPAPVLKLVPKADETPAEVTAEDDGTWSTPLTLERTGRYRVVAEFPAKDDQGVTHHLVPGTGIGAPGAYEMATLPPLASSAAVDGYKVRWMDNPWLAGSPRSPYASRVTAGP